MYLNSPQAEVFKESVLKDAIDLEEGQEVFQYRRLSTDEFEESIEITRFDIHTNLYQLKLEPYLDNNYWKVNPINVIGMNLDDLMSEYMN